MLTPHGNTSKRTICTEDKSDSLDLSDLNSALGCRECQGVATVSIFWIDEVVNSDVRCICRLSIWHDLGPFRPAMFVVRECVWNLKFLELGVQDERFARKFAAYFFWAVEFFTGFETFCLIPMRSKRKSGTPWSEWTSLKSLKVLFPTAILNQHGCWKQDIWNQEKKLQNWILYYERGSAI